MLVNAATGSAKNMAPIRLTTASNDDGRELVHLGVALHELDVGETLLDGPLARLLEHLRTEVDAERVPVDRGTRRLTGRLAGPATDVEHVLGAPDRRGRHHPIGMGADGIVVSLLVGGPVVALFAVPGCCHLDIHDLGHLITSEGHGTVQAVSRRGDQLVITNRKARHDYLVLDTWECGIMLAGPEVKSVREGRANLQDCVRARRGRRGLALRHARVALLVLAHGPRPGAEAQAAAPPQGDHRDRARHRGEGPHAVPLRVYFKDGRAKVELALARGKRAYDKRQALAERDAKREAERAMKGIRE